MAAEDQEPWEDDPFVVISPPSSERYDAAPLDFSGQAAALDNEFALWEILLGTALLYGLAIVAALVIRFRIEKKPLRQGLAFGYAAGIWFGLYSLFFALHALAGQAEQWASKPPISYSIAAFIAYHIMRKGSAAVATASAAALADSVPPSVPQVGIPKSITRWKLPAHSFHAVVLAIVGIMLLFPPWNEERFSSGRTAVAQVTAVGYGPVFSPPERRKIRSRVVIDWSRLLSQIGAVLFLAWGVRIASQSETEKREGEGVSRIQLAQPKDKNEERTGG